MLQLYPEISFHHAFAITIHYLTFWLLDHSFSKFKHKFLTFSGFHTPVAQAIFYSPHIGCQNDFLKILPDCFVCIELFINNLADSCLVYICILCTAMANGRIVLRERVIRIGEIIRDQCKYIRVLYFLYERVKGVFGLGFGENNIVLLLISFVYSGTFFVTTYRYRHIVKSRNFIIFLLFFYYLF